MKKMATFLLLAMSSNLTHGAQVNEYFLCTPKQATENLNGDQREYNCLNSSENAASDTVCDAAKIDKSDLKANSGSYELSYTKETELFTVTTHLTISRASGDFKHGSLTKVSGGGYAHITANGACTLQKETLKY